MTLFKTVHAVRSVVSWTSVHVLGRRGITAIVVWSAVHYACGTSCSVSPSRPTSGQMATITYDPAGGPLAGETTIDIHRGINNWSQVAGPDQPMTQSNEVFVFTYTVPPEGYQLNCCFNNGSGTWDNNNLANWNFAITPGSPP